MKKKDSSVDTKNAVTRITGAKFTAPISRSNKKQGTSAVTRTRAKQFDLPISAANIQHNRANN